MAIFVIPPVNINGSPLKLFHPLLLLQSYWHTYMPHCTIYPKDNKIYGMLWFDITVELKQLPSVAVTLIFHLCILIFSSNTLLYDFSLSGGQSLPSALLSPCKIETKDHWNFPDNLTGKWLAACVETQTYFFSPYAVGACWQDWVRHITFTW